MSDHEATLQKLREKVADEKDVSEDPGSEEEPVAEAEVTADDEEVAEEEIEEEVEEAKKSSTREYVVLTSWKEIGRIEAGSAEAALRALGKTEGDFAAIPLRSWNTFSIKTETTTLTHITPQ